MTKYRKWLLSGTLAAMLALVPVVNTGLSITASAAASPSHGEKEEKTQLLLSITLGDSGATATMDTSEVIYPLHPDGRDLKVKLTPANGKGIYGTQSLDDGRTFTFVLNSWDSVSNFTIEIEEDGRRYPFAVADGTKMYSWYDADAKVWTQKPLKFTADDLQDCLIINTNEDPDAPVTMGNFEAKSLYIPVSTAATGLCSALLVHNPDPWEDYPNPFTMYEQRDIYGQTGLLSAAVYVGGEFYSNAYLSVDGIVYYQTPVSVDDTTLYCDEQDMYLVVEGYYDGGNNFATMKYRLPTWQAAGGTAQNTALRLEDAWTEFEDEAEIPDEEKIPVDNGDVVLEATDTFTDSLNVNLTSELDKYRKELLSVNIEDLTATISGKPTEAYKTLFWYRDDITDTTDVSWGTVPMVAGAHNVKLDAGEYTITAPELVTLLTNGKPVSKVSVKAGSAATTDITMTPSYTLTLDATTKDFEFTANGAPLSGTGTELFMLEPNVNYMLVDKATGKQYSVLATDDTPHLRVTLGSDQGSIGTTNPTDFEDVPNTADFMTIVFAILGGIVAALAAAAGIVFFKMKRSK